MVDRHWDLLLQNRAALQLMSRFVESPAALEAPLNVMRLLFRGDGFRPHVINWDDLSTAMIQRLRREAAVDPADSKAQALLSAALEAGDHGGNSAVAELSAASPPTVEMHLRRDGIELRLFSAITTLGTPLDVTLQELRLETFFPADQASENAIRKLVD